MSATTIGDKWLPRLQSVLNWCADNDIIPDNPARGVTVKRAKASQSPRIPFTPDDLTRLFSEPSFDPAKPLGEMHWAMLLSLYCGTRPSELAQIKLDSVRHVRGVLVIVIEEETKNQGSKRLVPIHSGLVGLGFADRVDALRKAGETHLFPEWYRKGMDAKRKAEAKASQNGEEIPLNHFFPRIIPRRFNVTYRKNASIADPRKDFYAFRHTFKTGLSYAGVSREVRDYLAGHHDQSAGSIYEHEVSIERMKEGIEALHFDGLDLSALIGAARAA